MNSNRPVIIIVTGRPAAGKSTLANRLSKDLGIPLVSQDSLREELFNCLGWKDREWAQTLGKASVDMMFYFAEAQLHVGGSIIMDNTFHPAVSLERFKDLKDRHGAESIQIICDASDDILLQRFKARFELGTRHPGHRDEEVLSGLQEFLSGGYSLFLDIGGLVIELDTTDFNRVNYQFILKQVQSYMDRNR